MYGEGGSLQGGETCGGCKEWWRPSSEVRLTAMRGNGGGRQRGSNRKVNLKIANR